MVKIVIIGGGWAGCAAAMAAKKPGVSVVLLEKADLLLGCGLAAGIMRNNGRYTVAEELKCLGAGELVEITDHAARHRDVGFPGHSHASLYDTLLVEPLVREMLERRGVLVLTRSRAVDVVTVKQTRIEGVVLADGSVIGGDVFVEATGSSGPMGNCSRYGNGCAMCVLRCPSFGPRVSLSSKAGVKDIVGLRGGGVETYGVFSGSCELNKESLGAEIRVELDRTGVVILPVPAEDINLEQLEIKACQQYALPEYGRNIVLLDTGAHAKMMKPFYPVEKLRKIPGLERAAYECPKNSDANSVRFLSRAPRDNTLKVSGLDNLFCAGEKSGFFVGCTEAMATGFLAGQNAGSLATGANILELPRILAVGDLIAFENEQVQDGNLKSRFSFSGGAYFQRMKSLGLYTTDQDLIGKKVQQSLGALV